MTILLGVASSQEGDMKTIKEDVGSIHVKCSHNARSPLRAWQGDKSADLGTGYWEEE